MDKFFGRAVLFVLFPFFVMLMALVVGLVFAVVGLIMFVAMLVYWLGIPFGVADDQF